MVTTIQIENETWEDLNKLKKVGESFDEVIKKLLKEVKNENNRNKGKI